MTGVGTGIGIVDLIHMGDNWIRIKKRTETINL
jgi:hypothetical protein